MGSEQFSLCWDNFHKNMSSGMQSLLESEDLVDVTLAVEGRYLKAHKMVLSVCSPYFRELFQTNPCKHPIVFMKDVSYIALSDLLQFMYQGEVQVAQDNLTTFIKTAEALQIKGLTGDSNSQNDAESIETTDVDKIIESTTTTKRTHDVISSSRPTPMARVKKPTGPAAKRPKFTLPPSETASSASPVACSTPVVAVNTKSEVTTASTAPTSEQIIQFKMEPSESTDHSNVETIDESQADRYIDDGTTDDIQDDTEDYTLMDAGEDEPKAGTSADGMGDSQDDSKHDEVDDIASYHFKSSNKRKPDMPRYIVDGFVFHVNIMKGKPPMTYLRCLEYKRLGCHARAIIPCDGSIHDIKIKKPHNHPPDYTAEEKIVFMRELKEVLEQNPFGSIKDLYTMISKTYPNAAREMPFNLIRHKMNRWRRNVIAPTETLPL